MSRREFNSKRVSGTSVAELSGDCQGVQGCACQLFRPLCYNTGLRVVEKSVMVPTYSFQKVDLVTNGSAKKRLQVIVRPRRRWT